MAVYSFSTPTKNELDTLEVEKVKQYCEDNGINFSALVVKLIKEYAEELKDVRRSNS